MKTSRNSEAKSELLKHDLLKSVAARRASQSDALRQVMSSATVGIVTAGAALGVGRQASYRGAITGEIPTIRVGREIRVPCAKLLNLLGLPIPPTATGSDPSIISSAFGEAA